MSQVSGKLSSRVMNMKFMKFSRNENDKVPNDTEINKSKAHDGSQWTLRDNKNQPKNPDIKIKKPINIKIKRKVLKENVSITDLKRDLIPVVRGRRTVGDGPLTKDTKRERSVDNSDDDDDNYDLDKIFKQIKTDKKVEKQT